MKNIDDNKVKAKEKLNAKNPAITLFPCSAMP